MTTIATDGKIIASDSATSGSFLEQGSREKIFQLGEKILLGGAGTVYKIQAFLEYLADPEEVECPDFGDDLTILVIEPRKIWLYDEKTPILVKPPYAIGSGTKFAMGAMLAGATPIEAVKIACKLDPHSRGPVKWKELGT